MLEFLISAFVNGYGDTHYIEFVTVFSESHTSFAFGICDVSLTSL